MKCPKCNRNIEYNSLRQEFLDTGDCEIGDITEITCKTCRFEFEVELTGFEFQFEIVDNNGGEIEHK